MSLKYHSDNYHLFNSMVDLCAHIERSLQAKIYGSVLSERNNAIVGLLANALSILYSIRELLKIGYILSAEILLRTLLERVAVISYLVRGGDSAAAVWSDRWDYKDRPSLKKLVEEMEEPFVSEKTSKVSFKSIYQESLKKWNMIVHAHPKGIYQIMHPTSSALSPILFSGAMPDNKDGINRVALMAAGLATSLAHEIGIAFPDVEPPRVRKRRGHP